MNRDPILKEIGRLLRPLWPIAFLFGGIAAFTAFLVLFQLWWFQIVMPLMNWASS